MTESEYKEQQAGDTNQLKKAFDAGYRKGREEGIKELEEAECSLATAIVRLTLAIERSAFGGGGQEAERVKEKK